VDRYDIRQQYVFLPKSGLPPLLVTVLGNPERVRKIRERLVLLAEGKVLEIGVGPGVNFVQYDPARVCKVYALEPKPTDDPACKTPV
jgi:hypothetical protein